MPVMNAETFVNPVNLFEQSPFSLVDQDPDDDESPHRWWVLHTHPRAEKTVVRKLRERQINYFLPTFERQRKAQRRTVSSFLPLFPGYVFLLGNEDSVLAAQKTNQLVNCLPVVDQFQLNEDLTALHNLIASGERIEPTAKWKPGYAVEIVAGPLSGHRGTILRHGASTRLVVSVNFLQQGASVEVEPGFVQPV